MRSLLIALALVLLLAAAAAADSYTWNVQGVLAITGNDACNGTCVQALAFSFTFEWMPGQDKYSPPGTYVGRWLPSSNVLGAGPLGDFTLRGGGGGGIPYYMGFFNAGGDEIDLFGGWWQNTTPWIAPPFYNRAQLWSCQTQICKDAFVDESGLAWNMPRWGPVSTIVSRVPEPMTLLLVGAGLVGLLGARRLRRV